MTPGSKAKRQALKVALIYVIVSACWILFSDELLDRLFHTEVTRTWASILKGWAFVLVTGGLLYLMVRRPLSSWEREAEQRRHATEKLRASEDQLRLVTEATADGLWDLNCTTGPGEFLLGAWRCQRNDVGQRGQPAERGRL